VIEAAEKFGAGAGTHDAEAVSERTSEPAQHTYPREKESNIMNRQAATPKGFDRRIRDLQFTRVGDPRQSAKVRHQLPTVLTVLVAGLVTATRSLRNLEHRTSQFIERNGSGWHGLESSIADNTFSKVIPQLEVGSLQKRLVGQVKAEHRRRNLRPTRLPFATASIDGKNVATLRWHDLCRVLSMEPHEATPSEVKKRLKRKFPSVQFCNPSEGEPYALARVHTVTLTSSPAAVCIYQRPIEGRTNEIGAMPSLLRELSHAYGRTGMIEMLTMDAGNISMDVARQIVDELGLDYFAQIKSDQGEIHKEAVRSLHLRRKSSASATLKTSQNGAAVTYHLWVEGLGDHGWLDWHHARQLVRVRRETHNPSTGEATVGNRYYVCSKAPSELSADHALAYSRGHWRCEEETHWTSDVVLNEDKRRLSWSRDPHGVFVVSLLRMMALNILAVARRLSRVANTSESPTWQQVVEYFLLTLCAATLQTEAFDAVD